MNRVDAEIQFNSYEDALRRIAVAHPATKIIFIRDNFCDKTVCRMTKGDALLYRDSNHLNINGSLPSAGDLWRMIPNSSAISGLRLHSPAGRCIANAEPAAQGARTVRLKL